MKRSKSVFNAFAVASIVTASLAFTNKPYGQSYCVKTGVAGACTNFLLNQKPDPVGNRYRGYVSPTSQCSQQCSTEIRLLDQ
ncbi:MAG: hypothetical protein BGO52_03800 [Sphingobacteriales bacterium 44-61]|nr:MAG: hypothetical protein BGO52_03800 [Sphingobacteriales bacterium 44-61]